MLPKVKNPLQISFSLNKNTKYQKKRGHNLAYNFKKMSPFESKLLFFSEVRQDLPCEQMRQIETHLNIISLPVNHWHSNYWHLKINSAWENELDGENMLHPHAWFPPCLLLLPLSWSQSFFLKHYMCKFYPKQNSCVIVILFTMLLHFNDSCKSAALLITWSNLKWPLSPVSVKIFTFPDPHDDLDHQNLINCSLWLSHLS